MKLNSSVCTLYEGDYHFGAGALINSLYNRGYRGIIWAGYRGELPPWAGAARNEGQFQDFEVADECIVRFFRIETHLHLSLYKPSFMLDILRKYDPELDQLFYFDPDIVIKCDWSFYEKWCTRGVALCQETVMGYMPSNHPVRLTWKDLGESEGFTISRQLDQYFNSGFIGVSRPCSHILEIWQALISSLPKYGLDTSKFILEPNRTTLGLRSDQDLLNIAAMITPDPLSTIGPEGMGFIPGGFAMAHAAGQTKPWRKRMLREATRGVAPTSADKEYLKNVSDPIQLYSRSELARKQLDVRCGAAVSRFFGRR